MEEFCFKHLSYFLVKNPAESINNLNPNLINYENVIANKTFTFLHQTKSIWSKYIIYNK